MSRPRIDHIGLMVADLEAAVERLRPVFGEDVSFKDLPQYEYAPRPSRPPIWRSNCSSIPARQRSPGRLWVTGWA